MFTGIRAAMRTPLARPPGRRRIWSRWAPELCALAVYGLGLAVMLWGAHGYGATGALVLDVRARDFTSGVIAAYWAAGLVLVVFPLVGALSAWHGEHARGTADALLLTPTDHAAVVRGRYWHVAWPWIRFMLWMAPLYVALAGLPFVGQVASWNRHNSVLIGGVALGGSKGLFGDMIVEVHGDAGALTGVGLSLALGRWLCDAKSLLALVAIGSWASVRIRSGTGLRAAYLLLPLAMGAVFSIHDGAMMLLRLIDMRGLGNIPVEVAGVVYVLLAAVVICAEVVLALLAYRALARNFDAYAIGEKPSALRAERGGI